MAAETAAAAIARLEGVLHTEMAAVHGKLDVLSQEIHAGDRETLQAAAALGWRVEQLEKAETNRVEADKETTKQRRSLRVLAVSALATGLLFPIIVALIVYVVIPAGKP